MKTITIKNKSEAKEPVILFLLSHYYVHLCGVGAVAQHKFVMRHDKPIDFADRSEYWSEALFQGEDADKNGNFVYSKYMNQKDVPTMCNIISCSSEKS